MPDFGDSTTGEGERKVPAGAVYQRRLRERRRRRRARRLRQLNPGTTTDGRRIT